uniref:HD domain-containing protein n=1 Tax=Prevotella sp. GTC17259 TaxID=3236795 RepID=A0AB33J0E8_9BACT
MVSEHLSTYFTIFVKSLNDAAMRNVDILYAKAMTLAIEKHDGQTDKGGAKYVEHVKRVAARCNADETKIVALLHDLLEDTDVTPDFLLSMGFSQEVVDDVLAVTRQEGENYADFILRVEQSERGKEVKIADLEDNMDIRRLSELTEEDCRRLCRYLHSWRYLRGLEKDTSKILG